MRQQPDKPTMSADDLAEALDEYSWDGPPTFVKTPSGEVLRVVEVSQTPRSRDPLLLTDTIDPEREAL